jgi:hypothetical protein
VVVAAASAYSLEPSCAAGARDTASAGVADRLRVGAATFAVAAAVAACGDRPFVRADPPATSAGVTVALAGQRCRRRVRHDQNGILDLELALRVTNGGPASITIVPARLSLVVRGDVAEPDEHDAPFSLAPGATAPVRIHYRPWINARCDEPMAVSLDAALSAPTLRPLIFTPEASDT